MTSELFQSLMETDQSVFLYLNGLYTDFGDYFMSTFSGKSHLGADVRQCIVCTA